MAESYTSGYPTNNQSEFAAGKTLSTQPSAMTVNQLKKESNSAVYWFLGGVGVLAFLAVVIMAAGLGIYFYTQRAKNTLYTEKYPQPTVKPASPSPKPEANPGFTTQNLKDYLAGKKKVGKFELVKLFEDQKKGFFSNSEAEASAAYRNQNNQDVIIAMAGFSSKEKARNEFTGIINAEKKSGSQMIGDVRESEKSIAASFQSNKLYVLMFCNFSENTSTPCFQIFSRDRVAVADFYGDFFNK
jgi:hypothetical protein